MSEEKMHIDLLTAYTVHNPTGEVTPVNTKDKWYETALYRLEHPVLILASWVLYGIAFYMVVRAF